MRLDPKSLVERRWECSKPYFWYVTTPTPL